MKSSQLICNIKLLHYIRPRLKPAMFLLSIRPRSLINELRWRGINYRKCRKGLSNESLAETTESCGGGSLMIWLKDVVAWLFSSADVYDEIIIRGFCCCCLSWADQGMGAILGQKLCTNIFFSLPFPFLAVWRPPNPDTEHRTLRALTRNLTYLLTCLYRER